MEEKNLYLTYGYNNEKFFLEKGPKEKILNLLSEFKVENILNYFLENLDKNNIVIFDDTEEFTKGKFNRKEMLLKIKKIPIVKIFKVDKKIKELLLKNQISIINYNLQIQENFKILELYLVKTNKGNIKFQFNLYKSYNLEFLQGKFYTPINEQQYDLRIIEIDPLKVDNNYCFKDFIGFKDFKLAIDLVNLKISKKNNIQKNIKKLKQLGLDKSQIFEAMQFKNKTIKEIKNNEKIPIINYYERKYKTKIKENILKIMFNPYENISFELALLYQKFFPWSDLKFEKEFYELKSIIERELKGNDLEKINKNDILECNKIEDLKYYISVLETQNNYNIALKYSNKKIKPAKKYDFFINNIKEKNSKYDIVILNSERLIAIAKSAFEDFAYFEYDFYDFEEEKKLYLLIKKDNIKFYLEVIFENNKYKLLNFKTEQKIMEFIKSSANSELNSMNFKKICKSQNYISIIQNTFIEINSIIDLINKKRTV